MAKIISVGKGLSKYNVVISKNAVTHKNVMAGLKDKNKILVVTDSGIPKSFITDLKKILKNKKKMQEIPQEVLYCKVLLIKRKRSFLLCAVNKSRRKQT